VARQPAFGEREGGGGEVGGGGGVGAPPGTTAVCADVTTVVPAGFVAVTPKRSVEPASAAATVCVVAVSPTARQLLPLVSQRSQLSEKLARNLLAQVPSVAVSVWPTAAVPVIVGSPVFVGPTPVPVTTEVAFEVALPSLPPPPSNALTSRRIVKPTSPGWSVYSFDGPSMMPSQFPAPLPPSGGQRRQLY
jgi:hypothetical protein